MSVNKVIIVGNLGSDPEVRYTQNSTPIANLSVATSESWKDKQTGEQREQTEWHRVVCYRRLAEIAGEYLRKGSKVYIEGKLKTRKWQGQDGKDNFTTEIICNDLQMLDNRTGNAGGFGGQNGQNSGFGGHSGINNQRNMGAQQAPQGGFNGQQQGYGSNQASSAGNAPQGQPAMAGGEIQDDIPFGRIGIANRALLSCM